MPKIKHPYGPDMIEEAETLLLLLKPIVETKAQSVSFFKRDMGQLEIYGERNKKAKIRFAIGSTQKEQKEEQARVDQAWKTFCDFKLKNAPARLMRDNLQRQLKVLPRCGVDLYELLKSFHTSYVSYLGLTQTNPDWDTLWALHAAQ